MFALKHFSVVLSIICFAYFIYSVHNFSSFFGASLCIHGLFFTSRYKIDGQTKKVDPIQLPVFVFTSKTWYLKARQEFRCDVALLKVMEVCFHPLKVTTAGTSSAGLYAHLSWGMASTAACGGACPASSSWSVSRGTTSVIGSGLIQRLLVLATFKSRLVEFRVCRTRWRSTGGSKVVVCCFKSVYRRSKVLHLFMVNFHFTNFLFVDVFSHRGVLPSLLSEHMAAAPLRFW